MSTTPDTQPDKTASANADLAQTGLSHMTGWGTAWMEAVSELGAEVASFVADRIKEDVKTQHAILHCKDMAEFQHIHAQFIQKAIAQYQDETGKLVELSKSAFPSGVKTEG